MLYLLIAGGATAMVAALVWMARRAGRNEIQKKLLQRANTCLKKSFDIKRRIVSDPVYRARMREAVKRRLSK